MTRISSIAGVVFFLLSLAFALIGAISLLPGLQSTATVAGHIVPRGAAWCAVACLACPLPLCVALFVPVSQDGAAAVQSGARYAAWVLSAPIALLVVLAIVVSVSAFHTQSAGWVRTVTLAASPAATLIVVWAHLLVGMRQRRHVRWWTAWIVSASALLLVSGVCVVGLLHP